MPGLFRISFACAAMACLLGPVVAHAAQQKARPSKPEAKPEAPQDTGFLNRRIELHGITYRFQVYLPEDWRRDDQKKWPIILSLHGRGERGSEGLWQTQIGLAKRCATIPTAGHLLS